MEKKKAVGKPGANNKVKAIPGLGAVFGLIIWAFKNYFSYSTGQVIAYCAVGFVVFVILWALWKFRATPERKAEPSD